MFLGNFIFPVKSKEGNGKLNIQINVIYIWFF